MRIVNGFVWHSGIQRVHIGCIFTCIKCTANETNLTLRFYSIFTIVRGNMEQVREPNQRMERCDWSVD